MFRRCFLHLALLQILSFHCGSSIASPLLRDAGPAMEGEFPFVVSLSRKAASLKRKRHHCGGALITRRHVLTAAHCIEKLRHKDFVVVAGNVNIESGQSYAIKSWITFDEYAAKNEKTARYKDNDIAVITLKERVKAPAKPGVISKLTHDRVVGQYAITAGWGFVNETTKESPESLMRARFKILTSREYERIAGKSEEPPNVYNTLADPPAMLAGGDSGGPLILEDNHAIVGVNESSCDVDDPEDYDNVTSYHVVVDYYRDFIRDERWCTN